MQFNVGSSENEEFCTNTNIIKVKISTKSSRVIKPD